MTQALRWFSNPRQDEPSTTLDYYFLCWLLKSKVPAKGNTSVLWYWFTSKAKQAFTDNEVIGRQNECGLASLMWRWIASLQHSFPPPSLQNPCLSSFTIFHQGWHNDIVFRFVWRCKFAHAPMLCIYPASLCIAHDGSCRGCCHNLPQWIKWLRPGEMNVDFQGPIYAPNPTATSPRNRTHLNRNAPTLARTCRWCFSKTQTVSSESSWCKICIDCFPVCLSLLPHEWSNVCLVTSVVRRFKENGGRCCGLSGGHNPSPGIWNQWAPATD